MANTLHPYHALDQHSDNMLASLAHCLEAARSANNVQLVKLLGREKQEVMSPVVAPKAIAPWQAILQRLFSRSQTVHQTVHQFENGSDRCWYTLDPRTRREVCADSEAELRLWIQEHSQ